MLERKAKLGESVVYADADGNPYVITAEEALRQLDRKDGARPWRGSGDSRVMRVIRL